MKLDSFHHLIIGLFNSFFLASEDSTEGAKEHEEIIKALAGSPEATATIEKFFFEKTREAIKEASFSPVIGGTNLVNLVRDVLRGLPLQFAATEIVRLIFIKFQSFPSHHCFIGWHFS